MTSMYSLNTRVCQVDNSSPSGENYCFRFSLLTAWAVFSGSSFLSFHNVQDESMMIMERHSEKRITVPVDRTE